MATVTKKQLKPGYSLVALGLILLMVGALYTQTMNPPDFGVRGSSSCTMAFNSNLAKKIFPLYQAKFRDRLFYMTAFAGDILGDRAYKLGKFYEVSVTEGLLKFQDKVGGDILDIGMNIGSITVPAAALCKNCKVFSIEAHPQIYEKAQANVELNDLAGNVEAMNVALQADPKVGHIFIQERRDNMGMTKVAETGLQVAATTIDQLRHKFKNVKVVKIDVEGSEKAAIVGGSKWLAENPPCVIIMEVDKIDVPEMDQHLKQYGFTANPPRNDGISTSTANRVFKHEKCNFS